MKIAKNDRKFENLFKKLRRMGIVNQMGIERKADERAYKSNKTKSFIYDYNIIIITKVKIK